MENVELTSRDIERAIRDLNDLESPLIDQLKHRQNVLGQWKDKIGRSGMPEDAKFACAAILSARQVPEVETRKIQEHFEAVDRRLKYAAGQPIVWTGSVGVTDMHRDPGPNITHSSNNVYISILPEDAHLDIDEHFGYGRIKIAEYRSADRGLLGGLPELEDLLSEQLFVKGETISQITYEYPFNGPPNAIIGNIAVRGVLDEIKSVAIRNKLGSFWNDVIHGRPVVSSID